MRVVLDLEADGLKPTKVWCIVIKDIDTGRVEEYVGDDCKGPIIRKRLQSCSLVVCHNGIDYDIPVLRRLLDISIPSDVIFDTLVASRLLEFKLLGGHSLENWGRILKHPKVGLDITDWSTYTPNMLVRCRCDVELGHKLYQHLILKSKLDYRDAFKDAIELEHKIAWICREMQDNGFGFNIHEATVLYEELARRTEEIDAGLAQAFPPKIEIVQLKTKTKEVCTPFNPSSPKQIVERLKGFWSPKELTENGQAKICENNLATLSDEAPEGAKRLVERLLLAGRQRAIKQWIELCHTEIRISAEHIDASGCAIRERLTQSGTNETKQSSAPVANEGTWKSTAENLPTSFGTTSKKNENEDTILKIHTTFPLKSLTEWLKSNKVSVVFVSETNDSLSITIMPQEKLEDSSASPVIPVLAGLKTVGVTFSATSRVRAQFNHIGTWTHRLGHRKPNLANIAAPKSIKYKGKALADMATALGGRMRGLWEAAPGTHLVGCDAEGIQLRIFGHYIDDKRFIEALVNGQKELGTDPHSINSKILGCDRDTAKTFIYAFLLGAGSAKVGEILGGSSKVGSRAKTDFVKAYPGLHHLREHQIKDDAGRGYFQGFDGRLIKCDSEHLMLAGYLQTGEACIMKKACTIWKKEINKLGIPYKLVTWPHDEFQTEVVGDKATAEYVGRLQADSIRQAGEYFGLRCPMAGSYRVGKTWLDTH